MLKVICTHGYKEDTFVLNEEVLLLLNEQYNCTGEYSYEKRLIKSNALSFQIPCDNDKAVVGLLAFLIVVTSVALLFVPFKMYHLKRKRDGEDEDFDDQDIFTTCEYTTCEYVNVPMPLRMRQNNRPV
ncbi:receptor-type tyrosine- phosphatase C-like protein [Labeo rohita]|uniref:Receptor-type tyrosine-phosphatase C-like protein n=1 Tax=Labeo rohita TaxID=84645 RepID=A0A498LZW1_LABRO|nr:receptor-type tyrosine- phosphatase C-like protein [Labeo rohita]